MGLFRNKIEKDIRKIISKYDNIESFYDLNIDDLSYLISKYYYRTDLGLKINKLIKNEKY